MSAPTEQEWRDAIASVTNWGDSDPRLGDVFRAIAPLREREQKRAEAAESAIETLSGALEAANDFMAALANRQAARARAVAVGGEVAGVVQRFEARDMRGQVAWMNITQWIVSGGSETRSRQEFITLVSAEGTHRMTLGMTATQALESIWDDIVNRRIT